MEGKVSYRRYAPEGAGRFDNLHGDEDEIAAARRQPERTEPEDYPAEEE